MLLVPQTNILRGLTMSVDSRKIGKLEMVEGIIVKCIVCGDRFRVNQIYEEK